VGELALHAPQIAGLNFDQFGIADQVDDKAVDLGFDPVIRDGVPVFEVGVQGFFGEGTYAPGSGLFFRGQDLPRAGSR